MRRPNYGSHKLRGNPLQDRFEQCCHCDKVGTNCRGSSELNSSLALVSLSCFSASESLFMSGSRGLSSFSVREILLTSLRAILVPCPIFFLFPPVSSSRDCAAHKISIAITVVV